MKKVLLWLGIIVLGFLVVFGVIWVKVWGPITSCAGTSESDVWVGHLSLCVADVSLYYYLEPVEICDEEENCRYEYEDVNGEVLKLPEEVSLHLTSTELHSLSPYLIWILYPTSNDAGLTLHAYNLKEENFETVYIFSSDNRGLTNYRWENDEKFSVVSVDYSGEGLDVLLATRFTFEWSDEETWELTEEEVLKGEIECNSLYCEIDEAPSEAELKCLEDIEYCEWY